jgi:hypothetical protein
MRRSRLAWIALGFDMELGAVSHYQQPSITHFLNFNENPASSSKQQILI